MTPKEFKEDVLDILAAKYKLLDVNDVSFGSGILAKAIKLSPKDKYYCLDKRADQEAESYCIIGYDPNRHVGNYYWHAWNYSNGDPKEYSSDGNYCLEFESLDQIVNELPLRNINS